MDEVTFNGKSIRLFISGSIGRSFNDSVSLDFSATVGASYKVTDWFIVNTTLNKDKTNDGDSNNINYNLGFGVMW